jgi:hypothetical protein
MRSIRAWVIGLTSLVPLAMAHRDHRYSSMLYTVYGAKTVVLPGLASFRPHLQRGVNKPRSLRLFLLILLRLFHRSPLETKHTDGDQA